jgi:antitoxin component of MazEF toxin-antitoxin module
MARRKLEDKNIRKLTKVGKQSIAVTLPIEIIRELKWREKQKVTVKKSGRKIIIEDWDSKK